MTTSNEYALLWKKYFIRELTKEQKLKQDLTKTENSFKKEAKKGNISFFEKCLKYLEITEIYSPESKELLKKKLIELYYKYAAILGNESIFEYFRENKYSNYMPDNICSFIFQKNNNYEFFISFFSKEGTKYFNEKLFLDAINMEYVNIVNFLFENGCPLPERIFEHLAKTGNEDLIKWGIKKNLPFYDTFYILSIDGNIKALELVYQHGCLPDILSGKKIIFKSQFIKNWIENCTPFKDLILEDYSRPLCLDSDDCFSDSDSDSVNGDIGFNLINQLKIKNN